LRLDQLGAMSHKAAFQTGELRQRKGDGEVPAEFRFEG
jgi:hypothetical protein